MGKTGAPCVADREPTSPQTGIHRTRREGKKARGGATRFAPPHAAYLPSRRVRCTPVCGLVGSRSATHGAPVLPIHSHQTKEKPKESDALCSSSRRLFAFSPCMVYAGACGLVGSRSHGWLRTECCVRGPPSPKKAKSQKNMQHRAFPSGPPR
jgi:hypothetical protein